MRGGTLKLVKICEDAVTECAISNALNTILFRVVAVRREFQKAQPPILLSDVGMLILVMEWSQFPKGIISNFNEAFTQFHLGQTPRKMLQQVST